MIEKAGETRSISLPTTVRLPGYTPDKSIQYLPCSFLSFSFRFIASRMNFSEGRVDILSAMALGAWTGITLSI